MKKIFCCDCKYADSASGVSCLCYHPNNYKDSYYAPAVDMKSSAFERNKNNDCSDFTQKNSSQLFWEKFTRDLF